MAETNGGGEPVPAPPLVQVPYKNVREAAEYLGVALNAVREAIRDGRVRAVRVLGVTAIPVEDLEEWKKTLRPNARVGRGRPAQGEGGA